MLWLQIVACRPDVQLEARYNPNNPFSLFVEATSQDDLPEATLRVGAQEFSLSLAAGEPREELVLGLHADTEYEIVVEAEGVKSDAITHTTHPLLDGWPDCDVEKAPGFEDDGGVVCMNGWLADGRTNYFCVDRDGEPVWQLTQPGAAGTNAVHATPEGGFVAVGANLSQATVFTSSGGISRTYPAAWMEGRTTYHHDFVDMHEIIALSEGQWAGAIAFTTITSDTVDGEAVLAGGIVVVDPLSDEVLWDWMAHGELGDDEPIDPKLPYGRMGAIENQGDDWQHANALVHVVAEDGSETFLLSLRNQDWIIAIDIETGEVLWRLGNQGDFELTLGEWFFQQHAPEMQWHAGGRAELVIMDNGMERPDTHEQYSRVVSIEYDTNTWTARQLHSIDGFWADTRGDADVLPGGDRLQYLVTVQPAHVSEVTWPEGELLWTWTCPDYETGALYRVSYFPSLYDRGWWYEVDR